MTRLGGATAAGQQPERIVKARRDPGREQNGDAAGGQLDRQRQAIQLTADARHVRRILGREGKARLYSYRPFDKKLDRVRHAEGLHGPQPLTMDT